LAWGRCGGGVGLTLTRFAARERNGAAPERGLGGAQRRWPRELVLRRADQRGRDTRSTGSSGGARERSQGCCWATRVHRKDASATAACLAERQRRARARRHDERLYSQGARGGGGFVAKVPDINVVCMTTGLDRRAHQMDTDGLMGPTRRGAASGAGFEMPRWARGMGKERPGGGPRVRMSRGGH
jgi:hypothetical protein